MSTLVSTIEIDRPADEVFAYVTNPLRFPEWQLDVVRISMDRPGAPVVGTRFTTTRRIGGAERTMTQEVAAYDPPRSWVVRGVAGPIRPGASVAVEPLDGGVRSRVTFGLEFHGHGLGLPLLPLVRRAAAKGAPVSHRNAKRLLESGHPHAAR